MRKMITLIGILLMFAITLTAQEQYQIVFSGTVYIDGEIAPYGTKVEVKDSDLNNYTVNDSVHTEPDGSFGLTALGDDDNIDNGHEGGFELGDTIYFYVNNKKADVQCGLSGCNIWNNAKHPILPQIAREVTLRIYSVQVPDTCALNATEIYLDGSLVGVGKQVQVKNQAGTVTYSTVTITQAGQFSLKIAEDASQRPSNGDTLRFVIDDKEAVVYSGTPTFMLGATRNLKLRAGKCIVSGTVNINDAAAPVGTEVKVMDQTGETQYASEIISSEGQFSIIFDGPSDGEDLTFLVNGNSATLNKAVQFTAGMTVSDISLSSTVTAETLCTFVGIRCYLNGNPMPTGTVVKAKNKSGVVCGQTLSSSLLVFENLRIKKEDGDGDGAVDGDTITLYFNDIEAKLDDGNAIVCHEGETDTLNNITADTSSSSICRVSGVGLYDQYPQANMLIEAYTEDGIPGGFGTTNEDGEFSFDLLGDDPSTLEIDGFQENDTIIFRYSGNNPGYISSGTGLYFIPGGEITNIALYFDAPSGLGETSAEDLLFSLLPGQPNPFSDRALIRYSIDKSSEVKLSVYNILGELVTVLVNEAMEPGLYEVNWDGTNKSGQEQPTGTYFVQLIAGNKRAVEKISKY